MKRVVRCSLVVAMFMFMLQPAHSQSQGMGGMDMKDDKALKGMDMKADKRGKSQIHKGSGTVTNMDSENSSVTIAHGPIKSMNWPAVSMTFRVKDKAMLGKVRQGEKVAFEFVKIGKEYTITQLK